MRRMINRIIPPSPPEIWGRGVTPSERQHKAKHRKEPENSPSPTPFTPKGALIQPRNPSQRPHGAVNATHKPQPTSHGKNKLPRRTLIPCHRHGWWAGPDSNRRLLPRKGSVLTRLDYRPPTDNRATHIKQYQRPSSPDISSWSPRILSTTGDPSPCSATYCPRVTSNATSIPRSVSLSA